MDRYERINTAEELGRRLRLTNAERETLKLWQFLPIDKTEEELAEQAKVRERARRALKRREKGIRNPSKSISMNWQVRTDPGLPKASYAPLIIVSGSETRCVQN